jgi:hypothetical protein
MNECPECGELLGEFNGDVCVDCDEQEEYFKVLYWGCEACGHEVDEGKDCWECNTSKYLGWLDVLGNKA